MKEIKGDRQRHIKRQRQGRERLRINATVSYVETASSTAVYLCPPAEEPGRTMQKEAQTNTYRKVHVRTDSIKRCLLCINSFIPCGGIDKRARGREPS